MNQTTATQRLSAFDARGHYVYAHADLAKVFHEDSRRTLQAGLDRLVSKGLLLRVAKGTYRLRAIKTHRQ